SFTAAGRIHRRQDGGDPIGAVSRRPVPNRRRLFSPNIELRVKFPGESTGPAPRGRTTFAGPHFDRRGRARGRVHEYPVETTAGAGRSEEHTSELQSLTNLV